MPPVLLLTAVTVPMVVGVVVVRRQRGIGALLVAHGASVGLVLGLDAHRWSSPGWLVLDQLGAGSWVLLFLWLVLIAYRLPDGGPPTPFWRRWVRLGLAGVVLFLVGAAGDTAGFRAAHAGAEPPVPWLPEPVSAVTGAVGAALVVLLFFGSVVQVRSRLRDAADGDRRRLLWLVWGSLAVPAALLVGWADHFLLGGRAQGVVTAVIALAAVVLPVSIGIAVLRHRLFDIEVVLSRTLTYLGLTGLVLALYAGVLWATGALLGDRTLGGAVAVAVVAVAVHPVQTWLRRRAERWVHGYRSEPHVALRLLADRAEAADPDGLVEAVTTTVAQALRVRRAWIGPAGSGTPLLHRGEHVGDLAVEPAPGRTLGPADLALLSDLARYVAVIVRSEQQSRALRESRSHLVTAREEERRRLRRDLHDGLGPSLAAVVLTLDSARGRADAERDALLDETVAEVKAAISEVRRLVDDLRPPAIDEVGLVQAIRQRAGSLHNDVSFEVRGPATPPVLPAAVEVAAFRIASEAMTNVARHSGATWCRVDVVADGDGGDLWVTVTDDGHGAVTSDGVGLTSMRERAAELGGTLSVSTCAEGGLEVRARLPLGDGRTAEVPV
jgi:signal transduction histidine kinase